MRTWRLVFVRAWFARRLQFFLLLRQGLVSHFQRGVEYGDEPEFSTQQNADALTDRRSLRPAFTLALQLASSGRLTFWTPPTSAAAPLPAAAAAGGGDLPNLDSMNKNTHNRSPAASPSSGPASLFACPPSPAPAAQAPPGPRLAAPPRARASRSASPPIISPPPPEGSPSGRGPSHAC